MSDREFCYFSVVAVKDILLEMIGVGAGIMFSALETHFYAPRAQVAA